jgi:TP901 family phage tail tape measure protein
MASRVISIKVVYENREAIIAARAQAISNKQVADSARASAVAAQKVATETQKTARASAQAALANHKLAEAIQKTKDKADAQSRSFGSLIAYTAKLYGSFQLVSKTANLVSNELGLAFGSAFRLQQSMTLLGAAGSLTANQMASVRETVHSLSSAFPVAQEEVAAGALELVRMGYTGKELENVLGAVTKASIIMGTSVADTGQAMFTASNIFGYTSEQAGEVAAKLTYAANASALSLQQIGVALNYTAGTAKTAGVGLEPVLAMMATLRNLGVGASTIGTTMRTFFRELAAGGKAVKAIGGDINSLGLTETLKRFAQLDPRTFSDLFSKPASSGLQLLQGELLKTSSSYAKFLEDLNGSAAQTAFDDASTRFGKDLPGAVQLFRNSMTQLADTILTGGIGAILTGLVNSFTAITRAVNGMLDAVGKLKFDSNKPGLANFLYGPNYKPTPGVTPPDPVNAVVPDVVKAAEADNKSTKPVFDKEEALKSLAEAYKAWQLQIENMDLKGHAQDVEKTKTQYQSYAKQFEGLGDISTANDALREYNSLLSDQAKETSKAQKEAEKLAKEQERLMAAFDAEVLKQAGQSLRAFQLIVEKFGETLVGDEWGAFEKLQGDLTNLGNLYSTLGEEDKVEQIAKLGRHMGLLRDNSTFTGQFKLWAAQMQEFNGQAELAKIAIASIESGVQQLSTGLAENLVGAISGTKTAFIDFGEMFKGIVVQMIAQLIQLGITMAAIKIATILGFGATAAATGGVGVPAGLGVGTLAASGMTKVVRQPTSFIAGEAGAETVSVTPRSRINRDNGGGDIIVQINGDVYGAEKFNEAVAVANKRKSYV